MKKSTAILLSICAVPIKILFEYLEGRRTAGRILADFGGVTRAPAEAVVSLAADGLIQGLPHP